MPFTGRTLPRLSGIVSDSKSAVFHAAGGGRRPSNTDLPSAAVGGLIRECQQRLTESGWPASTSSGTVGYMRIMPPSISSPSPTRGMCATVAIVARSEMPAMGDTSKRPVVANCPDSICSRIKRAYSCNTQSPEPIPQERQAAVAQKCAHLRGAGLCNSYITLARIKTSRVARCKARRASRAPPDLSKPSPPALPRYAAPPPCAHPNQPLRRGSTSGHSKGVMMSSRKEALQPSMQRRAHRAASLLKAKRVRLKL